MVSLSYCGTTIRLRRSSIEFKNDIVKCRHGSWNLFIICSILYTKWHSSDGIATSDAPGHRIRATCTSFIFRHRGTRSGQRSPPVIFLWVFRLLERRSQPSNSWFIFTPTNRYVFLFVSYFFLLYIANIL